MLYLIVVLVWRLGGQTEKLVTVRVLQEQAWCARLGDTIILCKLLLFCTKDEMRMMWPLHSNREI